MSCGRCCRRQLSLPTLVGDRSWVKRRTCPAGAGAGRTPPIAPELGVERASALHVQRLACSSQQRFPASSSVAAHNAAQQKLAPTCATPAALSTARTRTPALRCATTSKPPSAVPVPVRLRTTGLALASPACSSQPARARRRGRTEAASREAAPTSPSHSQGTRLLFCALQNALLIALDAEPDSPRRIRDDGTAAGRVRPARRLVHPPAKAKATRPHPRLAPQRQLPPVPAWVGASTAARRRAVRS